MEIKNYELNGEKYQIIENDKTKVVKSENYNTLFNKETGLFLRWGKTQDTDPEIAPSCEIADIEISSGKCHNNCPFCYKSNKADGKLHNMTFDNFKIVFEKINQSKILTQIAFGITSPYDNPDFIKIMEYTRKNGVIPNYTCNGTDMTPELAKITSKLCGAVAISVNDKEKSYNAVEMLTNAGMKQINFHMVAHNNSYNKILSVIDDIKSDKRLKGLNALVILKYKNKGTNSDTGLFTCLSQEQYNNIFKYAQEKEVLLGLDSCSCHTYLKSIENLPNFDYLSIFAEPCESTLFSIYINSHCKVYPCSFCEGENRNENNWEEGIDLLKVKDFNKEIWYSDKINKFRQNLLNKCRKCIMYKFD